MFIVDESLKKKYLIVQSATMYPRLLSSKYKDIEESYSALQTFRPESLGQKRKADSVIPFSFIHLFIVESRKTS